jgi:hypothetical protein
LNRRAQRIADVRFARLALGATPRVHGLEDPRGRWYPDVCGKQYFLE